jgi:hypothetical protein
MSLYWNKHSEKTDTLLPQTIMRPFWHPVEISLDDQNFCIELNHDKPLFSSLLVLLLSLISFVTSLFLIFNYYLNFQMSALWGEQSIYSLLKFFSVFLLATTLLFLFFKMSKLRALRFNRKNHQISYPKQGFLVKYFNEDYDNFLGKIEYTKNPFGRRKANLLLEHVEDKHLILLCSTYENPQSLVGYWSFIVQYMKKGAPLPDVPGLHHYPNKTAGIIHQKTIDYS